MFEIVPQEAIKTAGIVFRDTPTNDGEGLKGISWIGIRYMLTEIIYGSHITNASDQINLSSVVDYWVGPNAVKREFEATKSKSNIHRSHIVSKTRCHLYILISLTWLKYHL